MAARTRTLPRVTSARTRAQLLLRARTRRTHLGSVGDARQEERRVHRAQHGEKCLSDCEEDLGDRGSNFATGSCGLSPSICTNTRVVRFVLLRYKFDLLRYRFITDKEKETRLFRHELGIAKTSTNCSSGRRRGDLEIRDANVADKAHLIIDVAMVHEFHGACDDIGPTERFGMLRTPIECSSTPPNARWTTTASTTCRTERLSCP